MSEWVVSVKDGTFMERIVISRQENNRTGPSFSESQRFGEAFPPIFGGVGCIEDIPCPQHCIDTILLGERKDLFDDLEPGARQLPSIIQIELVAFTAQMQISGVE